MSPRPLDDHDRPIDDGDRSIHAWQMCVPGFGEAQQAALKNASVLVSRVGGLGGVVAYELAAAGVGRLVLAHGGPLVPSDLNRQILMTHDWLGKPRVLCAERRLKELAPRLEVEAHDANVSEANARDLVGSVDLVVDCAPMFEERLALNREIVRQKKAMVECAMYGLEAQITTIRPGATACLACRVPAPPADWKRRFPVFGAVSGSVGCIAAMEAIKVLAELGEPLYGRLLTYDLRDVSFRTFAIERRADCAVCGSGRGDR